MNLLSDLQLILPCAIAGAAALTIAAILIWRFGAGRRKGKRGEKQVRALLKRCKISGDKLYNNVILSGRNGGSSTEIDHVLISTRGVFVIETKNRSGEIYGDDAREEWEQVLGKGDIRHTFRSPVRQNEGHVSFVRAVTGAHIVEGLVVFAEGNTQHVRSRSVFTPEELAAHLKTHLIVMSPQERDEAAARLEARMRASTVSAREHRKNVKRKEKRN